MRKPEKSQTHLLLTLESELIPSFFQFLRHGVMMEAGIGCSISEFLCQQLGVSPEYLEQRIQTCFLDGRPVDDVNSAIIKEGSTLSLSAAMPGLLGATLRKGSYYAGIRSQISYREEMESIPSGEGTVVLKLFNLVARELGPTVLSGGVWIKGKDLGEFLGRQSDHFRAGCKAVCLDGEKADLEKLAEIRWTDEFVFLQVRDL